MDITRRFFMYSLGTGVAFPLLMGPAWAQAPAKPSSLRTTVAVDSLDKSNAQTNVIVEFGIPLKAGDLANTDRIVVRDGATVLKVQEDGRAADRSGAIRFVSVAVLVPSLPAAATKVLTVTTEPGKPATGAEKTVAQLLALDQDAQCIVKADNGTPHSGDFRTAAMGSTTWTKGKPHRRDAFFHDGALRKTFTCLMPMMAGATAHSHMYAEFLATAFSSDDFSSDISWRFDPVLLNGWADEPKPGDQMLDVEVVTGTAKPVSRVAWTRRSPAVSIVVSASEKSVATSPPTPGTFNIDDHGRVIQEAGKGTRALIISVAENGASCGFRKVGDDGNNLAAGTYVAGAWKIHGFNLPNMGSLWEKDIWHGRQAKYQVRHERDHLFNSRMLLNYGHPSAYIHNDTGVVGTGRGRGGTSFLAQQGNHPTAAYLDNSQTYLGERYSQGNEPETTPLPVYQFLSLRKLENDVGPYIEAAALTRIYRTADIWAMKETPGIFDDATGVLLNTGVNKRESYVDNRFQEPMNAPLLPPSGIHHEDNHWYIPYLLTGKLYYLRAMHYQVLHANISLLSFNDLGLTRPIWNTPQVRTKCWADRIVAEAAVVTPSEIGRTITGWSKSDIMNWQESSWKQAYALLVDDGSGKPGWSSNNPPGPKFNGEDDPFYLPTGTPQVATRPTQAVISQWQLSYMVLAGKHMAEMGALTPAGTGLFKRLLGHIVNVLVSEKIDNPKAPSAIFGLGAGSYVVPFSEGKFLDWNDLADFFENSKAKTQSYYRMYYYAALVAADEWGIYNPQKTRKALKVAAEIMNKENNISFEGQNSKAKNNKPYDRNNNKPSERNNNKPSERNNDKLHEQSNEYSALSLSEKTAIGLQRWWLVKRND